MTHNKFSLFFNHEQQDYQISCIGMLKFAVKNKFHISHNIEHKNHMLLPEKNNLNIECVVANINFKNLTQLANVAMNALSINSKLMFQNMIISGTFFIAEYTIYTSNNSMSEVSFKLISTGDYDMQSKIDSNGQTLA